MLARLLVLWCALRAGGVAVCRCRCHCAGLSEIWFRTTGRRIRSCPQCTAPARDRRSEGLDCRAGKVSVEDCNVEEDSGVGRGVAGSHRSDWR